MVGIASTGLSSSDSDNDRNDDRCVLENLLLEPSEEINASMVKQMLALENVTANKNKQFEMMDVTVTVLDLWGIRTNDKKSFVMNTIQSATSTRNRADSPKSVVDKIFNTFTRRHKTSNKVKKKDKKNDVPSTVTTNPNDGRNISCSGANLELHSRSNKPEPPTFALATFTRNMANSNAMISTHVPSLPLSQFQAETHNSLNTATWLAKSCYDSSNNINNEVTNVNEKIDRSSVSFSKILQRETDDRHDALHDDEIASIIPELVDMQVGLISGGEMITLGHTTLVISGEVENLQFNLPLYRENRTKKTELMEIDEDDINAVSSAATSIASNTIVSSIKKTKDKVGDDVANSHDSVTNSVLSSNASSNNNEDIKQQDLPVIATPTSLFTPGTMTSNQNIHQKQTQNKIMQTQKTTLTKKVRSRLPFTKKGLQQSMRKMKTHHKAKSFTRNPNRKYGIDDSATLRVMITVVSHEKRLFQQRQEEILKMQQEYEIMRSRLEEENPPESCSVTTSITAGESQSHWTEGMPSTSILDPEHVDPSNIQVGTDNPATLWKTAPFDYFDIVEYTPPVTTQPQPEIQENNTDNGGHELVTEIPEDTQINSYQTKSNNSSLVVSPPPLQPEYQHHNTDHDRHKLILGTRKRRNNKNRIAENDNSLLVVRSPSIPRHPSWNCCLFEPLRNKCSHNNDQLIDDKEHGKSSSETDDSNDMVDTKKKGIEKMKEGIERVYSGYDRVQDSTVVKCDHDDENSYQPEVVSVRRKEGNRGESVFVGRGGRSQSTRRKQRNNTHLRNSSDNTNAVDDVNIQKRIDHMAKIELANSSSMYNKVLDIFSGDAVFNFDYEKKLDNAIVKCDQYVENDDETEENSSRDDEHSTYQSTFVSVRQKGHDRGEQIIISRGDGGRRS